MPLPQCTPLPGNSITRPHLHKTASMVNTSQSCYVTNKGKTMSEKYREHSTITTSEADELKVIVTELNEHVAQLSKMVLQLQKSLKAEQRSQIRGETPARTDKKTKTLH